MFNYNLNLNDFLGGLGIVLLFFIVVLLIVSLMLYIFGAIGLMELAKKNKISNPWFAFIPVANHYLLGKLGFEIYSDEKEKNSTITWIMLGLSAALVLVGNDSELTNLINISLIVLSSIAYYRIYKYLTPKYKLYTVLSIFFGGVPLYFNKNIIKARKNNEIEDASVVEETKDKEEKEIKPNFCINCGNKLTKTAKFCSNCGKKIN